MHVVVYVVKLLSLEEDEVVTGAGGPTGVVELPLYVAGPETVELVVLPPVGPTGKELVVELTLYVAGPDTVLEVLPSVVVAFVIGAECVWMVVVPLSVQRVVYVVKLVSLEDEVVTGAVGPTEVVELPLYVAGPDTVLELVVLPPVGPTGNELVVEFAL